MKHSRYSLLRSKSESLSETIVKVLENPKAFLVLVVLFASQVVFFSLTTPFSLPPDETYHYRFIQLFAQNGFSPFISNQEGFYILGQVTNLPFFLYHYLLSFPYRLVENTSHPYLFLRGINLALAIGSLFILRSIGNQLKIRPVAIFATTLVVTNTMMFVLLSGSINYDNLVIFLALSNILLTLKLFNGFQTRTFLLFLVTLIAGSLTKEAFLPIALASSVSLVFRYRRSLKQFFTWIPELKKDRKTLAIFILLVMVSIPFVYHYGNNVLQYNKIVPKCDQINTVSQCEQNPIYKRSQVLDNTIEAPQARSRIAYLSSWTEIMLNRSFGILAHQSIVNFQTLIFAIFVLFIIGIGFMIRYFSTKESVFFVLIFISSVYLYFLIKTNHSSYLRRGIVDLAVQGRYSFPVLFVLILAIFHFVFKPLKTNFTKLIAIALIASIFIFSSLPAYLALRPDSWNKMGNERSVIQLNLRS